MSTEAQARKVKDSQFVTVGNNAAKQWEGAICISVQKQNSTEE